MENLELLKSEAISHWDNQLYCIDWKNVLSHPDSSDFPYYQELLLKMNSYLQLISDSMPGESSV
jgi:hypothetical protein